MTAYCIECGTPKRDDDPRYDEWGGYVTKDNGGWIHLCPTHYEKYLEKQEKRKRNEQYYKSVIDKVKKKFPKAIQWLEMTGYTDGCDDTAKVSDCETYNRVRSRMESILESYMDEMQADKRILSDDLKDHIKKHLFERCATCRFWGEGNYCHKLNRHISEILIVNWSSGNFGNCGERDPQVPMTKTVYSCSEAKDMDFDLRTAVSQWKMENADIRDTWYFLNVKE